MADPTRIDLAVQRWLDRLDRGWTVAARDLTLAHVESLKPIRRTLEGLADDIAQAVAEGTEVSASWLYQQDRYRSLERQTKALIGATQAQVAEVLPVLRQQGIETGIEYADEAFRVGVPQFTPGPETFGRLPTEAIRAQVGFLQTPPIQALGVSLDPEAGWLALRRTLVGGLATGTSYDRLVRQMVASISGLTLTRALTITRTEMNRSYREGARLRWQDNPQVERWWWRAAIFNATRPPCPVCMGKHGSIYPKAQALSSHPNCRCAPVPLVGASAPPASGTAEAAEESLRSRSDRVQKMILGPTRWREWRDGNLSLRAMVEDRVDPSWGLQPRLIRLQDLRTRGLVGSATS